MDIEEKIYGLCLLPRATSFFISWTASYRINSYNLIFKDEILFFAPSWICHLLCHTERGGKRKTQTCTLYPLTYREKEETDRQRDRQTEYLSKGKPTIDNKSPELVIHRDFSMFNVIYSVIPEAPTSLINHSHKL